MFIQRICWRIYCTDYWTQWCSHLCILGKPYSFGCKASVYLTTFFTSSGKEDRLTEAGLSSVPRSKWNPPKACYKSKSLKHCGLLFLVVCDRVHRRTPLIRWQHNNTRVSSSCLRVVCLPKLDCLSRLLHLVTPATQLQYSPDNDLA